MARIPKEERHAQVDAIVAASSNEMHIIEMRIENIKRVRLAHIKPSGNVIIVAGRNGQGKSSVLDAVAWALTGTSTLPRYPIRKGQRHGSIKVDIGDFVVTRYFSHVDEEKSEKGHTYMTKLVVTGKRGEAFPSPQVLLDRLMGKIGFDPMAFMHMKDDDQLEELRKLVQFDIDIDALDKTQDADYDARREAGRLVDSLKNRIAAQTVPDSALPTEVIDVAAITARLQNAAAHNSTIAALRNRREDLLRRQSAAEASAAELDTRINALLSEAEGQDGRVRTYKVPTKATTKGAFQELQQQLDAIVIADEIDTAEVAAELTRANETNTAIQRAANYRQLEKELDAADEAWAAIDKRMKERDIERDAAIARAQMPIEKLSIGHGEVVYNGLPLSQASNAEQIRVSMALGMAANPKLRVLRISDGDKLDATSLQLIDDLAQEHKFQILVERIDTSGKVSVIMEDGEASGEDVEVEKEGKA